MVRPHSPIDDPEWRDLERLPPDELSRRAKAYLSAALEEFKAAGEAAKRSLQPAALLKRHRKLATVLGVGAGMMFWRLLRGGGPLAKRREESTPREPIQRTFVHSLLHGTARMAGKALPGFLFYTLARRVRGDRSRPRGRPRGPDRETGPWGL